MKLSSSIYKIVIEDGLGSKPFSSLWDFLKFAPRAIKLKAVLPGYFLVSRYFKDFRTRFLFSFHPLFIGGNPFTTPSIFLMLPYLEKLGGVWHATGGMYKIIEELGKLYTRMGGKIHLNSEVTEVLIENGCAIGVKVHNEEILSDIVVSNSHFANTYMDLIPETKRQKWPNKKILNKQYSMSCFFIYLGISERYDKFKHHTLILSERYKELVTDLFDKTVLPDDFSMYIHIPSKTDETMAPAGCDSAYILIPTPNLNADVN